MFGIAYLSITNLYVHISFAQATSNIWTHPITMEASSNSSAKLFRNMATQTICSVPGYTVPEEGVVETTCLSPAAEWLGMGLMQIYGGSPALVHAETLRNDNVLVIPSRSMRPSWKRAVHRRHYREIFKAKHTHHHRWTQTRREWL